MPVILPLEPSKPFYRVGTILDGVVYVLDVRWNASDSAWYFDLMLEDLTHIASGVKIVLGVLLARRMTHEKRPPGLFYAADTTDQDRDAGLDDLGGRVVVYYYPSDEVEEIAA